MANSWKVIWFENHKKYKKTGFPGDSPRASGVIDYAKSIIARGIPVDQVHVVSMRKGYPPTREAQLHRPQGSTWCPYCLKYREFHLAALMVDGIPGPEDFRCPVCTISIQDYYVRKYSADLVARMEASTPRLPKPKPVRRR